ncbi:GNAT family N-acetyltransferase [Brachybacterium hainanense]|uniref:GNAT family N-acetyltransferase n=1 Tax=Brachybacterium hainanense TaxID=1541174 RepID=A0ABV6R7I6_9MICO
MNDTPIPQPRLRTARLLLRPWRLEDAPMHRRLWEERDPRVPASRRIDAEGRPTLADLEDRIRRGPAGPGLGVLVLERREEGDPIGYCGLIRGGNAPPDAPELAVELLADHHRRGYATEAGRAVVEHARAQGHRRLYATVRDWNTASRRLLAGLGFVEDGTADPDPVHGGSLLTILDLRG